MNNTVELKLNVDTKTGKAQIKQVEGDVKKLGTTSKASGAMIGTMSTATVGLATATTGLAGSTALVSIATGNSIKKNIELIKTLKKQKKAFHNIEVAIKKTGKTFKQADKDTGGYISSLKKNIEVTRQSIDVTNKFKKSISSLKFIAVGTMAIYGTIKAIKEMAAEGDRLDKLTTNLNISVEALQELEYAAERGGLSISQFDKSLQTMNRRISFATRNTGAANAAFKSLGIDVEKLNELSADEQLKFLADRLNQVSNESERGAYYFEIFGLAGIKMNAMLKDGSDGMSKLQSEARKTGGILSGEATTNSAIYTDATLDLNKSLKGLKIAITESALPALTLLVEILAKAARIAADTTRNFSTLIPDNMKDIDKMIKKIQGVLDDYAESPFWTKVKGVYWEKDIKKMRELIIELKKEKKILEEIEKLKAGPGKSKMFKIEPRPETGQPTTTTGDNDEAEKIAKQIEDINKSALERIAALKGTAYERELILLRDKYKKEKALLINNQISTKTLDKAFKAEIISLAQQEADRIMKIKDALQVDKLKKQGKAEEAELLLQEQSFCEELERYKEQGTDIGIVVDWNDKQTAKIKKKYRDEELKAHEKALKDALELEKKAAKAKQAQRNALTPQAKFDKTMGDAYGDMGEETKDFFAEHLGIANAEGFAGQIETTLVNPMTDFFNSINDGSKTAKEAFKDMAVDMLKSISQLIVKMLVMRMVQEMVGMAMGAASSNTGGGVASGAGGGGVGSAGNAGVSNAGSYQTGQLMANGGVWEGGFQAFANGGTVTKPTLGLVGEGKYNEAIIPLPDGRSVPVKMSGGGNTTVITNNITVESSGGDKSKDNDQAKMIANAIDVKIKQSLVKEQRHGGLLHRRS